MHTKVTVILPVPSERLRYMTAIEQLRSIMYAGLYYGYPMCI